MKAKTPTLKRNAARLFLQVGEDHEACSLVEEFLSVKRPASRVIFTDAAKQQLLAALESRQFNTVKEAHGWMRMQLGVHVAYQTVWRFVQAKGLLVGGTLHSRRIEQGA